VAVRAIVFSKVGEPKDVLALHDLPDPRAGPGEVLVKVDARPVHPADSFFVRGTYRWKPQLPQIAGIEGSGLVVELGPGVDRSWGLEPGGRVVFRRAGTWASLARVPAASAYPVASDLSAVEACQLLLNPLTAQGLLDVASPEPGRNVLVNAAGSVVGRWLIALAKARGLRPFAVARSPASREKARAAGAEHAFADDEDYAPRIQEAGGASAAFDAAGGPAARKALDSLAPGARFVAYGLLSGEPIVLRSEDLIYRGVTLRGFGIQAWLEARGRASVLHDLELVTRSFRENRTLLPTLNTLPLERFQDAVSGQHAEKPILLG
jgi:NADPH:quinone reductase-like Zn-dependent oxidoreductase